MEKGKTIKQIADEIGVSKQAVFKKIKSEPLSTGLQEFMSTVDGKLMVSVDGETIIKRAFAEKKRQPIPSIVSVNQNSMLTVLKETIDTLQGQLEVKDKRIDELTAELAKEREHSREREQEIAVLADQAQKLQLAQMKQPLLTGEEVTAREEQPKKKRLFERFFSKEH